MQSGTKPSHKQPDTIDRYGKVIDADKEEQEALLAWGAATSRYWANPTKESEAAMTAAYNALQLAKKQYRSVVSNAFPKEERKGIYWKKFPTDATVCE